jgi:hypothetical protein
LMSSPGLTTIGGSPYSKPPETRVRLDFTTQGPKTVILAPPKMEQPMEDEEDLEQIRMLL